MRPPFRKASFGRLFCAATLVLASVASPLAQKPDPKKADQKADAAAQAQTQALNAAQTELIRTADAAMAGQAPPSDFPIEFQNDFMKAQANQVWIPMILSIDSSKMAAGPAALYIRVVPRGMTAPPPPPAADKTDKKKHDKTPPAASPVPNYPFQDITLMDLKPAGPGQPIRIARGIGVPAGSYDLYIVLREQSAAGAPVKTGILKQPLDVPSFSTGEFSTSTVLLATRLDQLPAALPADQQADHPYVFGQTEIVVAPDRKFKKSDELVVLFQIYNPMLSPEKKFNLEATYTFFRQAPDGEKRFNSTEPQSLTTETMGPGFDPTSGSSSIQAGQAIPLQSFTDGTYRLEIKITDKLSTKVLTQNVTFTVSS